VPKGENLYSLLVGAHAVVEVVVNATEVNASDSRKLSVGDESPDQRLFGERPKRLPEFFLEGVGCCGAVRGPPPGGLSDLARCPSKDSDTP
jgi:hypothetical protein